MGESSLSVVCLTGEEVGALDIRFSYCSILLSDGVFAAKISGRWRFSDLISYFCKWFRAYADRARHIYERFVTFSFTLKLRKLDTLKEM